MDPDDHTEDDLPAYFHAGCNMLCLPREIEITKFKISEIKSSVISFEIKCSKGTYIRSIARDFGNRLGCGAYLSKLRRTKIGDFDVNNACTIDDMVNIIKFEKSESN